jgi:cobyrinic acid a,c-diamide synthase
VLLVVDAASMARSAAAIVHGYRTFDLGVRVAGVIFNRVGSDHHELLLRDALADVGVPVLGALRRDERVTTPERHLGLVPAEQREAGARAALAMLADAVERYVDLDEVVRLARSAPAAQGPPWSPRPLGEPVRGARIAIARGPAFSFHYQENLELLEASGAELLPFDPVADDALPEGAGALILAGGFPEVYGGELAANEPLRAEVAAFARSGKPVLAECGGLLYLAAELDGQAMCGALPVRAQMTRRLTLGYREATAMSSTSWLDAGEEVRGHEFHYSQVEALNGGARAAWKLAARGTERDEGFVADGVQASFLHVHWAAFPALARRLAEAAQEPA